MKKHDADKRLRLLAQWDYKCVLCGREFATISCVTFEHMTPKSRGGTGRSENMGPSHHACNNLRGTASIIAAAAKLERSLCTIFLAGGQLAVATFLGTPVPNRAVSHRWETRFTVAQKKHAHSV